MEVSKVLIIGGMIAVLAFFMVLAGRYDMSRKKRLLSGDYHVLDAVVIAAIRYPDRKFDVRVKVASGVETEMQVSKTIYKAVNANTPGLLIPFGKEAEEKKIRPQEFFPTIPVEE